jgi:glycosyltransferase involved in cell wall biosynthesis
MTENPLVSVIIPTYNRAAIVGRTIDNIFQQTYGNIEVIVVDDGSTDDTQSVLKRYGDRIQAVTQSNRGPAVARNHGTHVAHGEILAFQDSDDLWEPTKLERQVALLGIDKSIPCCLCNVLMRYVNGKPVTSFDHSLVRLTHDQGIWLNVLDVLATRFVLFNQAVAIRRQAFEKVGGFPEDLRYLEDYDLPLRLAFEGPWAFIREPLVMYGQGSPGSFSVQAQHDHVVLKECELAIYERILKRAETAGAYASACRNLRRRVRIVRRQLVANGSLENKTLVVRTLNRLRASCDRYCQAIFRRSPWFPQPKTISVDRAGIPGRNRLNQTIVGVSVAKR